MKATLETIAGKTGFSKSTISRVLNNKALTSRISPEAVDAILKVAEECGYVPNKNAKSLRANKTSTIGLAIPSIANPYFAEIANVIVSEARKYGYTTIVTDTSEDPASQNAVLSSLLDRQVAGIIIAPCSSDASVLEKINDRQAPVILVDRYCENSSLPYVVTNNFLGGYQATKLLIRNGHKNIACIQGPESATPSRRRIDGYMQALKEEGLEDKARIVGRDFSIQNGYVETKFLLHGPDMPTAIFALSNTIGLGALKAVREAGLSIPKDISLISFDNNIYLDYLVPSITRVGQLVDEMGRMAVKLLHESIFEHKHITSRIELSPEIIVRESVAPILGTV